MAKIVAITGGIGSGKSVVSQALRVMGYEVLDTDQCARQLMQHDPMVISELKACFGAEIYNDEGVLMPHMLSAKVFGSQEQLLALNAIVHPAVKRYTVQWADGKEGPTFVETALLYAAGMQGMMHSIWRVTAPEEVRIERVMKRNGLARKEILARIRAQQSEKQASGNDYEIINDGLKPLLPQIITGIQQL